MLWMIWVVWFGAWMIIGPGTEGPTTNDYSVLGWFLVALPPLIFIKRRVFDRIRNYLDQFAP